MANAEVVSRVAEGIGVGKERIIVENRPYDTFQEAEMLAPLLGQDEFLLVTSAIHMPRAMQIFQERGLHPIAVPTDYIIKQAPEVRPSQLFPNTRNLSLSKLLLYEWLADKKMIINNYWQNIWQ